MEIFTFLTETKRDTYTKGSSHVLLHCDNVLVQIKVSPLTSQTDRRDSPPVLSIYAIDYILIAPKVFQTPSPKDTHSSSQPPTAPPLLFEPEYRSWPRNSGEHRGRLSIERSISAISAGRIGGRRREGSHNNNSGQQHVSRGWPTAWTLKRAIGRRKKRSYHAWTAARVLRNRFVGTLDWATIHEERYRGTSRGSNNGTPPPATLPREHYTAPPPLGPHTHPLRDHRRLCPAEGGFASTIATAPLELQLLSPPWVSRTPLPRRSVPTTCHGHPYAVERTWGSYVARVGAATDGTCVTRSLDYTRACKNYYYGRERALLRPPQRHSRILFCFAPRFFSGDARAT